MKNTKIFFIAVSLMFFLGANLFAQSNASANAEVKVQLKKGLAIQNLDGDLDFGEIVLTGSAVNQTITPDNGVRFLVTGHPGKDVTVTFSDVTLTNNAWVSANGGNNDVLQFTANVDETGGNSTYTSANNVNSGDIIPLVNNSGVGNLYLWLGGTIAIRADQEQGDYTGTFTMTVAY